VDEDQDTPGPTAQEEDTAAEPTKAEPLSSAERAVVQEVLKSYKAARPAVRHKILASLAAEPDAVNFFRQMIKRGS
jgi:hypothetical protein